MYGNFLLVYFSIFSVMKRKAKLPDITADVAVVIDALTLVCVDLDASTEDFYKVRTSDGVEGFCMRKYIALSK